MPPTETHSEEATEILSIQMPASLAARIRARVHAGEFDSESELVVHDLLEADDWRDLPAEPLGSLEEFLAGIPELIERLDRGEEKTYTIAEVREHLAARRTEFLNG